VCLDGLVGFDQDLQAVLGVLVCAGVITGHSGTRGGGGGTRRTGGARTLNGPATLSAARGWRRSVGRPRRSTWGGMSMGISVDGKLCCVVLCCVVLRCVVLCCVVLCCVVLCCVVLCCVVLCCVVLCCVVLCWLCCVVSCWLCCVVWCCVVSWSVVLCGVVLCCVVLCYVGCVVVLCAVEQESGELSRRGPQDLSVTVELGVLPLL
jgi:hypothetical protein